MYFLDWSSINKSFRVAGGKGAGTGGGFRNKSFSIYDWSPYSKSSSTNKSINYFNLQYQPSYPNV